MCTKRANCELVGEVSLMYGAFGEVVRYMNPENGDPHARTQNAVADMCVYSIRRCGSGQGLRLGCLAVVLPYSFRLSLGGSKF